MFPRRERVRHWNEVRQEQPLAVAVDVRDPQRARVALAARINLSSLGQEQRVCKSRRHGHQRRGRVRSGQWHLSRLHVPRQGFVRVLVLVVADLLRTQGDRVGQVERLAQLSVEVVAWTKEKEK